MKRILLMAATGLFGAACWVPAASAGVVYANDFSSDAAGFSGAADLITSPSGEDFLYFGGSGGSATLTLSGLAPHGSVSVSFDLYAVGSLDGDGYDGAFIAGGGSGDYFDVTYAGVSSGSVFHQAFANYNGAEVQSYPTEGSAPGTGAASIDALGYNSFPVGDGGFQDAEYSFSLVPIADSGSSISFTFADNSNQGPGDEFYGIDNLVVSTDGAAVPEPAAWTMMLVGFGVIGGAMRSRRKFGVGVPSEQSVRTPSF